ncbi:MAG: radical SAM protein [Eubacteriales bacterium]|nr:radical SAM protein [Eubacteriales bacterium]
MKILLIQPKMNMRPMDTKLKTRMSPSLALLTLAKLTPPSHQIKIVNENIEKINFNESVDLVAITVTVDVFPRAIEIASEFRKRGVTVIAGGIHITAVPNESVPYFDAICVGVAERVWQRILTDKENNSLQKIYKDTEDLKGGETCSPDYKVVDPKKYLYTNIISTSRGCPHKCDFCYNSCINSVKYINRPIDDVVADIMALKTKHIMFIDDNFIGNPNWTREFLLCIKPLNLKWNAAVTVNILNHLDLLDLMKKTGCQSLFIGFETINANSLKSVHKNQNNIEKYDTLIREIHSRGIMINGSIVFGLPEDDESIFENTLNWLVQSRIETVTAHILTPYPGTVLHKDMLTKKQIKDFNLSHYNTAHVVFEHEKLTAKQLYDRYIWFYKEFYSIKNILRRIPEDKAQRVSFLLFNFLYRKYGKFTEILSSLVPLNLLGKIAEHFSYFKGGRKQSVEIYNTAYSNSNNNSCPL